MNYSTSDTSEIRANPGQLQIILLAEQSKGGYGMFRVYSDSLWYDSFGVHIELSLVIYWASPLDTMIC